MTLREDLDRIREAILAAVDPYAAVARHVTREDDVLTIDGQRWMLNKVEHLVVLAIGKAAVPMAMAMQDILGPYLSEGLMVTKYGHASETSHLAHWTVIEAGHPIPDEAGVSGGRAIIDVLNRTTSHDLVVVLLSGGASALVVSPVANVSLDDLQDTTELLLKAGANIVELNAVRKHLSQLKGGQLARLAAPASVVALILSDVVGDPLDVIASGPTAPDPTTYGEALDVLDRYRLTDRVSETVIHHLKSGVGGRLLETPKAGDSCFNRVTNVLVGSNVLAAQAAVDRAQALEYHALLLTTFIEGEAREVAKVAVALAKGVRHHGHPVAPPACLVWGGETTVTVRGQGKGGRNQELALAAALGLEDMEGVALLALATDGTDGPTDAAGAMVDGETARRARQSGWDIRATLKDNNAYPLLEDIGALMKLGPTGTNVNDVLVLLVV